jgi:transposase
MPRGKAYTKGQKEVIVTLKQSYDQERLDGETVSTKDPANRVAKGLNVSLRTVKSVLAEDHRTGKVVSPSINRGKPAFRILSPLETVIRHRIRELNRTGQYVSIRSLGGWIYQEHHIEIPDKTLWRTLKRMGFEYGRSQRRSVLKEREYVIIARREYLRKKLGNRSPTMPGRTIRPEVYLDESYIHVNHSVENTWYFVDDGPWVNKPSGKGLRLILVNAITEEGWIPHAKLVFQAKQVTGDYHGQMNYRNFSMWFKAQLLPNIPPQSLIFMDNAPYHNLYVEDAFPTPKTRKAELKEWLKSHHPLEYDDDMLKPELYKKCRELCPPPQYLLDGIAENAGHTIIRTPQYHPELQPIEFCWGVVKNYCAQKCDYTKEKLKIHLEEGFQQVTPMTLQEIFKKVRREEDRYWKEDELEDENAELLEEELQFTDYV